MHYQHTDQQGPDKSQSRQMLKSLMNQDALTLCRWCISSP
jgi:hypothetical protein